MLVAALPAWRASGVLAQVGLARLDQRAAACPASQAREQRQVAPIGGERVGGEAVLDPERVDETVDRCRAAVLMATGPDDSPLYSSVSFCAATTFL